MEDDSDNERKDNNEVEQSSSKKTRSKRKPGERFNNEFVNKGRKHKKTKSVSHSRRNTPTSATGGSQRRYPKSSRITVITNDTDDTMRFSNDVDQFRYNGEEEVVFEQAEGNFDSSIYYDV